MSAPPQKKSSTFQSAAFNTGSTSPESPQQPRVSSPLAFLRRAASWVRGAILKLLPFLVRMPRRVTAGIAALLILFGTVYEWRKAPTPINSPPPRMLGWTWWTTPRQLNAERTLPAFDNANIQSVEVVAQGNRVWIAGDAGLLAYSDDDAANWTTFHYDPITGTMVKDAPVTVAKQIRLVTWHVEAAQSQAQQQPNTRVQAPTQDNSAAIRGTVTDQGGATISGANVALTNVARKSTSNVKTATDGTYNFPYLQPGTYNLRVSRPGFVTRVQTKIALSPKQSLVIPLVLSVSAVSQTVTVQAEVPTLQTETTAPAKKSPPERAITQQAPPKQPPNWTSIAFSGLDGSVAGQAGSIALYSLYTSDGGTVWTLQRPADFASRAVSKSINTTLGAVILSSKDTHISSVARADPNQAWTAGEQPGMGPVIYHSTDQGQTWTLQYPSLQSLYPQWRDGRFALRDVAFREDGKTGFAAGTQGAILRTRDGGQHWEPITRGAAAPGKLSTDYRWWQQPVRIPAPLSLLMFLFGLLFLVPVIIPEMMPRVVEQTIASVTVSDAPVVSPIEDTLGFAPVARAISGLLRNKGTKLPITLAITAKWGRGKTSLMSLVQQDLKASGWRTVWFNAWHHQEELSLLAALLQTVRQKAPPSLLERNGVRYRARLLRARVLRWQTLWVAAACLVLYNSESTVHERHPHMYGCAAQYLYERSGGIVPPGENLCAPAEATRAAASKPVVASAESEKKAADKPGILEFIMRLLFDAARNAERLEESTVPGVHMIPLLVLLFLVSVLGWQVLQSFGANPAELLTPETARHTVSELEARTAFLEKFRKQYGDVVEALGRYRLAIFVDDLDRCRPEKISEMMEAANYLMAAGPCALVMALEEDAVIAGLGLSFQRIAEELVDLPNRAGVEGDLLADARNKRQAFGRHYVEKLINVVVQVPMMDPGKFTRVLAGAGKRSETPAEQRTRRMRRLAEVSRVPAAAIVLAAIILFGGRLLSEWLLEPAPTRPGELTTPPAQTSPAIPTQESRTASVGTVGREVASTPPAMLPLYVAARAPLPQRWFAFWWQRAMWALLLLPFAAAFLARRPPPVTTDSAEFLNALRLWAPVLAEVNPSPRSAKRLLNRLRYLAMLEREAAKEPDTKVIAIPEPLLVAFGALDVAAPGSLARHGELAACWLVSEKAQKPQGISERAWSTLRDHKSVFNSGSNEIPAAQFNEYCQRFVDLSAGIVAR